MAVVSRKTVSVLFCDVVDSTPLGARLDPEALRGVMERYFAEARTVVEHHGGTVEKFIGDAVMAVFGVPQVHEDDALRCVRTATDLRAALETLNERLEPEFGVRLAVRMGITTGEVVAGTGETLVTGMAVNLAQRLQSAAATGEILLAEAAYRLVSNAALVEPVEPLQLKGIAEAVPVWRLLAVLAGVPGLARRLDSKFVGRDRERLLLEQAFGRAVEERSCHLFTVLGAAGVGKSRLVTEVLREVRDKAAVLIGRCQPYGEGITFWPLAELVRRAAGLGRGVSPQHAKDRIAALLEDDPDATAAAERVAAAIGLGELAATTEETFWAVRKLLEALARRKPVVVAFDDVHWAEPTFLDLVDYLADWTRDVPVLLICLARPELLDDRPTWAGGKLNATSILLEPLNDFDSAQLVHNLLGVVEASVTGALTEAAEGNPLFVEELLAMLVEDGRLRLEDGRWVATGNLSALTVPPTIHALLTARLELLNADERELLQTGAVIGRFFSREALQHLAARDVRPELETLVRKELIRRERVRTGADERFRFRHILIRDAAYGALSKEARADLHERFADFLEHERPDLRELEELVGYHLEQAYGSLAGLRRPNMRLATRASSLLSSAGRRALARGDAPAAANLLQRALALPGLPRAQRTESLLEVATALYESGRLSQAEVFLAEALEAAVEAGDRRLEARALVERSYLHLHTDPNRWVDEALPTAQRAIRLLTQFGDDLGLARAWILELLFHYVRCRVGEMEMASAPALVHARRTGDQRQVSTVLDAMTRATLMGPTPVDEALSRCEAIASERPDDRSLEAVTAGVRAGLEAMRGRFDEARALYRQSQSILDGLGQIRLLAAMRFYSGGAEFLAADLEAAERELRAGADALDEIGDRSNLSTVAAVLAQVLDAQGRTEEALEYTVLSEHTASSADVISQVTWRHARARLATKRESFAEGLRLAEEAKTLAEDTDAVNMQGDALLCLGEVLASKGRVNEAAAAIAGALHRYEAKGNLVSAARARSALADTAVEVRDLSPRRV